MQYTTERNGRCYNSRRAASIDLEVEPDNDLPLFRKVPKDMIRHDGDLPQHLQTRELAILRISPYFSDSQSAGRILNRIGHKARLYDFDGEAPQHIALIAGLALEYMDNMEALRRIGETYVGLLKKGTIILGNSLTRVKCSLEKAISNILREKSKRNPANLPRLL